MVDSFERKDGFARISFSGAGTDNASRSTLVVKTPDILSIHVTRTRGDPIGKASATFLYNGEFRIDSGSLIQIYLHRSGGLVFTGFVKRLSISPSEQCAGQVTVSIQAEDQMHKLVNKRFTRRQKLSGIGPVAFITAINKRTYTGQSSNGLSSQNIDRGSSPLETLVPTMNFPDWTQFIQSGQQNTFQSLHPLMSVADPMPKGGVGLGGGGSTDLPIHDHTSFEQLGPAKSVFGVK